MWCWYYRRRMEEKLGGVISKPKDRALRRHLQKCSRCAEAWGDQIQVRSMLKSWETPEAPLSARRRVMSAIHQDPFTREHRKFRGLRWRWIAVECAVAALLVLAAFHFLRSDGGSGADPGQDPAKGPYPENYIVELMNDPGISNLSEGERDILVGGLAPVVPGTGGGKPGQDNP